MLTTVEGLYENGTVQLLEPLPGITRARVAVMVLPESAPQSDASPPRLIGCFANIPTQDGDPLREVLDEVRRERVERSERLGDELRGEDGDS